MNISDRRTLSILVVLVLVILLSCSLSAYATGCEGVIDSKKEQKMNINKVDDNDFPVLQNFLWRAVVNDNAGNCNFVINDENGNDLTIEMKPYIFELYRQDRVNEIAEIVSQKKIKFIYRFTEKLNDNNPKITLSAQTERFSEEFYEIGSSSGYTKEWLVRLTGYVTYNTTTQTIVSASSPSLSISNASWGQLWSAFLDNVNTGRTIYPSKVLFWGNYTMKGHLALNVILPTLTYDFGNYQESFYAYPAF